MKFNEEQRKTVKQYQQFSETQNAKFYSSKMYTLI